jgi:hypothetical protein
MIPANGAPHDPGARDVLRSLSFAQRPARDHSNQVGRYAGVRSRTWAPQKNAGRLGMHAALAEGTDRKGLRPKAELEVKGQRHPCKWACRQTLNADGSLTLQPTAVWGETCLTDTDFRQRPTFISGLQRRPIVARAFLAAFRVLVRYVAAINFTHRAIMRRCDAAPIRQQRSAASGKRGTPYSNVWNPKRPLLDAGFEESTPLTGVHCTAAQVVSMRPEDACVVVFSPAPYQPSPKGLPVRSAHRHFRGLLSLHSRCGLHTRAVTNS